MRIGNNSGRGRARSRPIRRNGDNRRTPPGFEGEAHLSHPFLESENRLSRQQSADVLPFPRVVAFVEPNHEALSVGSVVNGTAADALPRVDVVVHSLSAFGVDLHSSAVRVLFESALNIGREAADSHIRILRIGAKSGKTAQLNILFQFEEGEVVLYALHKQSVLFVSRIRLLNFPAYFFVLLWEAVVHNFDNFCLSDVTVQSQAKLKGLELNHLIFVEGDKRVGRGNDGAAADHKSRHRSIVSIAVADIDDADAVEGTEPQLVFSDLLCAVVAFVGAVFFE